MRARLFLCLVAVMAGSCVRQPEKIVPRLIEESPRDCGLQGAIFRKPTRIFGPSRACTLPVAQEIAYACADIDFVREYRHEEAETQSRPDPAYEIRDASCTFDGPDHKSAACTFQYRRIGRDSSWQTGKSHLTYWFRELTDEITDGWYVASWDADAVCGAVVASDK